MTRGDRRIAAARTAVGRGNWTTAQADKGPSSRTDDEGRSTDIGQQHRSPDDAGWWQADTADGQTCGLAPPPGRRRSWDLKSHRCNQSTEPWGVDGRVRLSAAEGANPTRREPNEATRDVESRSQFVFCGLQRKTNDRNEAEKLALLATAVAVVHTVVKSRKGTLSKTHA
ncbi:unnamed protein product [Phytophthora fragariaefolia]|uniref:Unnamed protein product n=1 Tax=Phytophthora fragariaefolia TaxID=1490495 RepID=A0A9W6YPJ9_9STRA|nr:unnamed protein product [Phytophthora fragariaefolia]